MKLEYYSPEKAYEIAGNRLNDASLQTKINAYLGGVWPDGFNEFDKPRAVYAPYLAKGSKVELEFLDCAIGSGFEPLVATYLETEFVTANSKIVDCYRPPLILPKGQNLRQWVVPESYRSGAIGDAMTIYSDMSILDYWSGIRDVIIGRQYAKSVSGNVTDFSEWYKIQAKRFGWEDARSKSAYYYNALMGLYASGRGVLFAPPASEFTETTSGPAASLVAEALGVYPLVTCELNPTKRDWADLSFLSPEQTSNLKQFGKIAVEFNSEQIDEQ